MRAYHKKAAVTVGIAASFTLAAILTGSFLRDKESQGLENPQPSQQEALFLIENGQTEKGLEMLQNIHPEIKKAAQTVNKNAEACPDIKSPLLLAQDKPPCLK